MIHLGIYQHYKGKYYQVIGLARHSETLEELVVYQALYGGYGLWVRPTKMFGEEVLVDSQSTKRFKFIAESFSKVPSKFNLSLHIS